MYVVDRRRRQGGLEPRARADRQAARGHRDRVGRARASRSSRRSSSTASSTATAPSCGCSSAPASSAPTWSIAVTGDDEDNILISPGRAREVRRRRASSRAATTRATSSTSSCSASSPAVSATDLILRLIEHEVPKYGLVHLLDLPAGAARDHRARGAPSGRPAAGSEVEDLGLPDGSLVISILRDGGGFVPHRRTRSSRPATRCCSCSTPGSRRRVTERFTARPSAPQPDGRAPRRLPADRRRAGRRQLRALAARGGRRRLDPAGRPRARPALQPAAALEGLPARARSRARTSLFRPDEWWEEQRHRAADPHERDEARRRRARGDAVDQGRGARSTRRCSPPARTCGACASTAASSTASTTCARFGNSDAIQADAERAERVVLIGGSYIGCEVAASLTAAHGVKCSIVMHGGRHARAPLRQARSGGFFQGVLEEHGVEVHGGDELERFEGDGRARDARS